MSHNLNLRTFCPLNFNLRTFLSSGKFLRAKICSPESFRLFCLCVDVDNDIDVDVDVDADNGDSGESGDSGDSSDSSDRSVSEKQCHGRMVDKIWASLSRTFCFYVFGFVLYN